MAGKKNEPVGRVVHVSKDVRIKINEILIAYDKLGVKKKMPEVLDIIFELGANMLHRELVK